MDPDLHIRGPGGLHQGRPVQLTPAEALAGVMHGNDVFVTRHDPDQFRAHIDGQAPFMTMLSCADSRVNQTAFNFDAFGRVFSVRDIGNQLRPVAGSVDFGVLEMKTPLLMVMGHVHCGAVKAAMGNYEGSTLEIMDELDRLHLPLRNDDCMAPFETRWQRNCEANVDHQVGLCMRRYKNLVAAGSLAIVGMVYDFANLYERGYGRIICVNLNGQRSVERLNADPLFAEIKRGVLDAAVARAT